MTLDQVFHRECNPRSAEATLSARLTNRTARVGVVGLGYVGLPLVRELVRSGFAVTGLDIDTAKVETLRAGRSYIAHVPDADVLAMVSGDRTSEAVSVRGRLHPTADFAEIAGLDVVVICVPTPLTRHREPDLSYVENTAATIACHMKPGTLVVLESTTYPGTTREVVAPILSADRGSGTRNCGSDFFLAFSPERENPGGNVPTRAIPKLVGGLDPVSGRLAHQFYSAVMERAILVSRAEVAEAAKLLENIYRAVNIALVNELKMLFDRMGLDIWEVVAAAASKPFGFQAFWPGPGWGGHCIPVDPFYLTWLARRYEYPTRFVELAGEINWLMPEYVLGKLADALNDRGKPVRGSRVLVLGLAYKRDVDDLRESPAVILIEKLRAKGAWVDYHDPHIPRTHKQREHDLRMVSVPLTPESVASYDAVLIATDHSRVDYAMVVHAAQLVIDTRNATAAVTDGREKIVKA